MSRSPVLLNILHMCLSYCDYVIASILLSICLVIRIFYLNPRYDVVDAAFNY